MEVHMGINSWFTYGGFDHLNPPALQSLVSFAGNRTLAHLLFLSHTEDVSMLVKENQVTSIRAHLMLVCLEKRGCF